jgi:succinate dehydrogenase / fumarate reductase cytochrome b subunit
VESSALEAGPRRGAWVKEVWHSTIGKKVVVGVTGLVLGLYLIAHAVGNLKALQGAGGSGGPHIDQYAEWLRTLGEPAIPRNGVLWVMRVILFICLVVHVVAVLQLRNRNRAARPKESQVPPRRAGSVSARTMLVGGLFVLVFLVFHILQFTTRTIQVTPVHQGAVFANLDAAFSKWYLVLFYVTAVLVLGFHLRHAFWSVTQTAGWAQPNRNPTIRRLATGTAIFVTATFASVPLALWTGLVG